MTLGIDICSWGGSIDVAARAVTNAHRSRQSWRAAIATEPGLLPCRVHSFYSGLAGLWVCMDPQCTSSRSTSAVRPAGKLYSQPRDTCDCGARVLGALHVPELRHRLCARVHQRCRRARLPMGRARRRIPNARGGR